MNASSNDGSKRQKNVNANLNSSIITRLTMLRTQHTVVVVVTIIRPRTPWRPVIRPRRNNKRYTENESKSKSVSEYKAENQSNSLVIQNQHKCSPFERKIPNRFQLTLNTFHIITLPQKTKRQFAISHTPKNK